MKIIILIFMFFIIGGLIILSNYNLTLYKLENFSTFSEKYVFWLDQVYLNVQNLFFVVFDLDWFPRKV